MSDTDGEINYKVCKQIYDLIKDYDFGKNSFARNYKKGEDYVAFKGFLLECYQNKQSMSWL